MLNIYMYYILPQSFILISNSIPDTYSPVENKNDLELDFKVFSSRILVVQTLYMMNPTDATLASLSVLKN